MGDVLRYVHGIPSGRRMLLMALANFANGEGVCWPSIKSLAEDADLGERHVSAELKELQNEGYITIVEVPGKSSHYHIHIPRGMSCSSGVSASKGMNHSSGVNHSASRTAVQGCDEPQFTPTPEPQATPTTLNRHKTVNEPSVRAFAPVKGEPKTLTYSDKFSRFWAVYPKRKKKGDAAKAFEQLRPNEELLELMIKAVREQAETEDWREAGGKYIPLPASWIRGERWLDEPTEISYRPNRVPLP